MKKIILFLFLTINILTFSRTTVSWNVEESYDNNITVTCQLRGDIYASLSTEVEPFNLSFCDGEDYNLPYGIKLVVRRDSPYGNEVAFYECYLEKDFEKLATFYFKVRNELIIEEM